MTLIGLACREEFRPKKEYEQAITKAGAQYVWLPVITAYEQWLKYLKEHEIKGVLLPGGGDINPQRYSQQLHPKTRPMPPEIEEADFCLIKASIELKLPILGICLGVQEINVYFGGDLYQHIPEQVKNLNPVHFYLNKWGKHPVKVDKDSKLYRLVECEQLIVNSTHHQAIDTVGRRLRNSAISDDGIIEAIETQDDSFIIGVQWHPERLIEEETHMRLFAGFIKACQDSKHNKTCKADYQKQTGL